MMAVFETTVMPSTDQVALETMEPSEESQYIASRYDGLPVGPSLSYTFETQEGVPYDASNKMARKLSPFTFRLVVPEALVPADSDIDVNLIGKAGSTVNEWNAQGNQLREALGQSTITNDTHAERRLTDLNATLSAGRVLQTTMGTEARSVLADNVTVADIQYQVEKMLQTPPLTLFINPTDMSISYTTVQQYSQRTRHGKIFERWGEGQPTMQISGSTGAWCAGINPSTALGFPTEGGDTATPTGVQFATKRDSAAFQQFVSLYHLYRNNGYIYDTVGKSEAMLFVGAVAIDYDQMTYVGNINSFEYSYDEKSAHRIQWSMEFTIGKMYDHAEAPFVLLPESSPSVTPGSFSVAELSEMMSHSGNVSDTGGGVGMQVLGLSGTSQFRGQTSGEPTEEEIEDRLAQQMTPKVGDVRSDGKIWDGERYVRKENFTGDTGGDPDSTSPLAALGFFTPSGMFVP
jgi:hypothetical protein